MSPRTEDQFNQMRDKSRNTIVESALKLFSSSGFHGTSIGDIAKDARISKGLIYNYFDSKEQLLEAVILQGLSAIENVVDDTPEFEDSYQRLEAQIRSSFTMLRTNTSYWKLYISLLLQPTVIEHYRDLLLSVLRKFLSTVEAHFRAIGSDSPREEAKILAAIIDGASIHYLMDAEGYPLDSVVESIIKKYRRTEEMK